MKIYAKRFYDFAVSRRLAIWLLAALLFLALLGNIIPQIPMSSGGAPPPPPATPALKIAAALRLDRIYFSYPFYITVLLLFINLLFCMARRVRQIFEDSASAGRFFSLDGLPLVGSLLFHLSMVVIMAGAVYDVSTRMRGGFVIAQGQELSESHQSYVDIDEAPFFLENHSFFKVLLKESHLDFRRGTMLDTKLVMNVTDGDFSKDFEVRVNKPLLYRDTLFVLQQYGFSPLVDITDKKGKTVAKGYVNLAPSDSGDTVEDDIALPGTDMHLKIRLFPEAEIKDGKIRSVSQELKNPKLMLQLDRNVKGGKIKQRLYKGYLSPGDTAEAGGYRLSVGEIRYWFQFDVTKEPGKKIVFGGFWIGVAGLCLRMFLSFLKPIEDDESA